PSRSRWPMPATSSGILFPSSATAAPSCSARSLTRTASAATSSSRGPGRPRSPAAVMAAQRSDRSCANTSSARRWPRWASRPPAPPASVSTGAPVLREPPLPGAVPPRVAASHIRVGTFQYFAARGDTEAVKRLADHVIERHYPHLKAAERPYPQLLSAVI